MRSRLNPHRKVCNPIAASRRRSFPEESAPRARPRPAINHRDLLRPNADTHFKSSSAEFLEVFVNRTFGAVIFKLHFRRERRNKARITVIALAEKLLAFRVPGDHPLRTSVL